MTRIDRFSATVVAIRLSGQTVMANVAGGTSTPPTPKPAIVPRATAVLGLSGFTMTRAPLNAVMIIQEMIISSRLLFLKRESSPLNTTAPVVTLIP